jgi:hypothetical protein
MDRTDTALVVRKPEPWWVREGTELELRGGEGQSIGLPALERGRRPDRDVASDNQEHSIFRRPQVIDARPPPVDLLARWPIRIVAEQILIDLPGIFLISTRYWRT